jgi:hypothetical protein
MKKVIYFSMASVLFAFSNQVHASNSERVLNCTASGKTDRIVKVSVQITDLEGQVCSTISTLAKDGTSLNDVIFCSNASVQDPSIQIGSTAVTYGTDRYYLETSHDNSRYLIKTYECDYNHEEVCAPGIEHIESKEKLNCALLLK